MTHVKAFYLVTKPADLIYPPTAVILLAIGKILRYNSGMDYVTELKKYLSVKAVGKTAYLDLAPDDEPFRAGGELYTLIYCDKGEIKIESDDFSVVTPESNLIVAASGKEIAMSATKKEAKILIVELDLKQKSNAVEYFSVKKVTPFGVALLAKIKSTCREIFGNDCVYAEKMPRLGVRLTEFQTLKNSLELLLLDVFSDKTPVERLDDDLMKPGGAGLAASKEIYEFLRSRIDEKITLADISDATYFSVPYIKAVFKKYANKSVMTAFAELKAEKAKELLRSGLSVKEVAEKLSYSSEAHFSSAFKKTVGLTPTEFRNGIE